LSFIVDNGAARGAPGARGHHLPVWTTIAGLIFGGLFAAPRAAVLTKHAPTKVLMVIVGLLIIGLSVYNLSQLFR
jgi:uncharacterized membrane protein YfcA